MEEKVSIGILAYNHEKFMAQTLDGIFAQQVDFPFTVYINDDASTDATVAVILGYMDRYPGRIVLFENEQNRGQMNAVNNFLAHMRGEYMVICDGDDYWTYEGKLREQVSFLDAHPDYVAACHDARIESDMAETDSVAANRQTKKQYKYISQFTTYRGSRIEPGELLEGITYIQNCTLIWRRFDPSPYLHLFRSVKYNLDWIFNFVLSLRGYIHYRNEPWAVYRDHASGRTKNNLFFEYYFDKIRTLHQMKTLSYFEHWGTRRILYALLAKQYNDLQFAATDGGRKTKKQMRGFRCRYLYYSLLSVWGHYRFFRKNREELMSR